MYGKLINRMGHPSTWAILVFLAFVACRPAIQSGGNDLEQGRKDAFSGVWSIERSVELENLLGVTVDGGCCLTLDLHKEVARAHLVNGRTVNLKAQLTGANEVSFSGPTGVVVKAQIDPRAGNIGGRPLVGLAFSSDSAEYQAAYDGYLEQQVDVVGCVARRKAELEFAEFQQENPSGPP